MAFENDFESGGIIRIHPPSEMFENMLDVLRKEKLVYIYFAKVLASCKHRKSL